MRIMEIEQREYIVEGAISDFFSAVKDMPSDLWGAFREDKLFRTLVIGFVALVGFSGFAAYQNMKQADFYKKVDTELHEIYDHNLESGKYLEFEQEFEKYLVLKHLASQTKTETTYGYDPATDSYRTTTKTVPRYPEKILELAQYTEMLIDKYNIVVEK